MYEMFKWTSMSKQRNELTKSFEPIQPYILMKMADCLEDVTFFDIGANIGVYSIFIGSRANVNEVYAFEPMSECVLEIEENVKLNGLMEKVHVRKVALSDSSGNASFRKISDYSGGSGITETHLFQDFAYQSELNVMTEMLDTFVNMKGKNIVLKIDVEGHEYQALLGARRLLSDNFGIIQVEIHESSPYREITFDLLGKLGWTKVLRVGWDYYFSNLDSHKSEAGRAEAIDDALTFIVDQSLNAEKPSRRSLVNGVTLELSKKNVDKIKKMLSFIPLIGGKYSN